MIGHRQLFVRFTGCNLACRYCDTGKARAPAARCAVYRDSHGSPAYHIDNPVTVQGLMEAVCDLKKPAHRTIAITGGEPLLHAGFLAGFLPAARGNGLKVLLETNGTMPDELSTLAGMVDYLSMDIKIPSTSGEPSTPEENLRFLQATDAEEVFVKIVVNADSREEELQTAVGVVNTSGLPAAVVLQPAMRDGLPQVSGARLLELHDHLLRMCDTVRVIPQAHRILGVA